MHPLAFYLTGMVLMTGSLNEYYNLIAASGVRVQKIKGLVSAAVIYTVSTLIAASILDVVYLAALFAIFPVLLFSELYRKTEKPFDSLAHTLTGLVYVVVPFSFFPFASFGKEGLSSLLPHPDLIFSPGIVIGFFILVWANDTGAYLSGVSFGRHKLFERISPGKTWEGFAGGLILALLAAWLMGPWLGVTGKIQWLVISVLVSVAGTLGDLSESLLKRSLGVKDSGSVLPGHGGFLDRFDSTLTAFPLACLFIILFG